MKKTKIVALASAMAISASAVFASVSMVSAAPQLGDVNLDGKVTANDARMVLRFSAKLDRMDDSLAPVADANGDGKVTASDARLILRYSARLESKMGGEEKYAEIIKESGSETTKLNPGDLSTKPVTRPGTTKPDATEPTTTPEPTTEPETTTEPEETTKDPLADIPADIKAFASAKFAFSGTSYSAEGAQPISMATNGENLRVVMNMDMDGKTLKIGIMKRNEEIKVGFITKNTTKFYMFSDENKTYCDAKTITDQMNLDELGASFKPIDLTGQEFVIEENVAFNGKGTTCYSLSDDSSTMKFYVDGDKLVGMATLDSVGNIQQELVFTSFTGDVPDSTWSFDGYKSVNLIKFFANMF